MFVHGSWTQGSKRTLPSLTGDKIYQNETQTRVQTPHKPPQCADMALTWLNRAAFPMAPARPQQAPYAFTKFTATPGSITHRFFRFITAPARENELGNVQLSMVALGVDLTSVTVPTPAPLLLVGKHPVLTRVPQQKPEPKKRTLSPAPRWMTLTAPVSLVLMANRPAPDLL